MGAGVKGMKEEPREFRETTYYRIDARHITPYRRWERGGQPPLPTRSRSQVDRDATF
jgi:hypothetical protein